ncbi:T9SS type A sorting domain-containing protein [Hymenobacter elongatus]|uniref:T9SS type A sorting domain-containing protein n=1 Tax=Hymenobacter elongatus TaxID=877208 RepID=A0A4Z0PG91_9BACT|nr:T9SS type A sorting domain-containing protein [Hymenobacter elongatus]TGE13822.1 T9SS type A sorting domain-containing protein [Hymenobacter elongatus]
MKKLLLCLLTPATLASAQIIRPVNLQPAPSLQLAAGSAPSSLAVGSLNRDAYLDLVVVERGRNDVAVYLQTAAGSFGSTPAAVYPAGQAPSSVVIVPLVGATSTSALQVDDLMVVSGPSNLLTLLRNNENTTGTFTALPTQVFGNRPTTSPLLIAGYFDRQVGIDVAYTHNIPNDPYVGYLSHQGNGQFLKKSTTRMSSIEIPSTGATYNFSPTSMSVGDFDGDGLQDMVATGPVQFSSQPSSDQVVVRLTETGSQEANWSFTNRRTSLATGGVDPISLATADLNRDFRPEMAIANEASNNIIVFVNNGVGEFVSPSVYAVSATPRQVLFADLNNDSYPEMLVLTADNQVNLFVHTQQGTSARYPQTPLLLPVGINPTTMLVAGLDYDDYPELLVGCSGDQTVRIFRNMSADPLSTQVPKLSRVAVYPNPAATSVTIGRPADMTGPMTATLYDALGRVVRQQEASPLSTMAVEDLPRGIYILRLENAGSSTARRLVLQ